jgi:hypothetical protein
MAKTLPPYGDQYLGDNPWAKRVDEVIMYLTGRNTSAVVFGTDVDSDDIAVTGSSAAQTVSLWTLPAGTFMHSLYAINSDSWGSSDNGNITVGDTASVDTWFTDTLLNPNGDSAVGPLGIARSNALAPPAGKFYDTGATIAATFPLSTTACVTGLTKFVLVYSMAR